MLKKKIFNRYEPPSPSLLSDRGTDDACIHDLDLFHDRLPQPYHRIDKLLWEIFDSAWQIIEIRNKNQFCTSTKKVAQKIVYEEELLVKEKVVCITSASNCLFCGVADGIIVYKLPNLEKYSKFVTSRLQLRNLHLIDSSHNIILILLVYDIGSMEIIGFSNGFFCCLGQTFEDLDGSPECVTLSKGFFAVCWKEQSNQWLSVYELQIREWVSVFSDKDHNNEKVTPLSSILKIKPISLKPTHHSNLAAAVKAIELCPSNLGTGLNHYLTANFFRNLQLDNKTNENKNSLNLASSATVHFLKGPTKRAFLSESHSKDCDSILVWWENSNLLLFYELEINGNDVGPVCSLPQGDTILITAVNAQTDLIAISLMNKTICVWNRYKGELVQSLLLHQSVSMMIFATELSTLHNQLSYILQNGQIWQVDCDGDKFNPQCVDDRSSESFAEQDFNGKIFPGPNNLLAVFWDSGEVVLYNGATATIVCQLEFYNQKGLWAAELGHFLVFSQDHIILVIGEKSSNASSSTRLFLFHPKNNTTLKEYFETKDVQRNLKTNSSEDNLYNLLQQIISKEKGMFFHLNKIIDSQKC